MIVLRYGHVLVSYILIVTFTKADEIDDIFRLLYSETMKCDHNRSLNLDVSETFVYFYDFTNNLTVANGINNAADLIQKSLDIDYSRRLIVYVPGYKGNIYRDIEDIVRETFKEVSNIYLIIIDHSAYTYETNEKVNSYERSVMHSYYIGEVIGEFLAQLEYGGDKIHCIGHSLGGHIIGYASEVFTNITKKKVWRATGLDPAGPCFADSPLEDKIRSGVAKYVEIYHCNAGHFGTSQVLGDTDFFFNYQGMIQPNCDKENDALENEKCYHRACVHYWMATVHDPDLYLARACNSYESFVAKLLRCHKETCIAGYYNPGNVTGKFCVSTENSGP